jgi:SnoaL-like domain
MTAQVPPTSPLDLARRWQDAASADDVVLVGNLLQAYALFTDAGLGDDLAGLFTAEATWDGTALGYATATGPREIADVVLAHHDPTRRMVHLPGPPLAVRCGEDLEVISWTLATRFVDGVARPLIFFGYHDVLARVDGSLRFRSRRLDLTFRPAS